MEVRGRFAPSPSGRMHLGNLLSALLAWLDVRSQGGTLVLRIEDLDPDRCTRAKAEQLVDDLRWLGLDWDEGGVEPDYCQSNRSRHYEEAFKRLSEQGLTYPCYCTRAERLAASAPHRGEGQAGSCRCTRLTMEERTALEAAGRRSAWRVRTPEESVCVEDGHLGRCVQNLRWDCGDFIIRRSDGVWAYQLAVVVDDGLMGITHVVRGQDLLESTPRQVWLHRTLGFKPPQYFHLPLLVDREGRRLSKRERDMDMGALRERYTPAELTGVLAWYAGLLDRPQNVQASALVSRFAWSKVPKNDIVVCSP